MECAGVETKTQMFPPENECTPTIPHHNSTMEFESLKVRPGLGALCPYCGIVSSNFSKCQRCLKGLPENVMAINLKQKPAEQSRFPTQNSTSMSVVTRQLVLPKEVVKVRPGLLAVCPHCGILSSILSKCQRCQKGLPENVKIISSDACHKASVQYALPTQNFTSIPEGQSLPTKDVNQSDLAALCPQCGWVSLNFSVCRHCNFMLPENVKTIRMISQPESLLPNEKSAERNIASPLTPLDSPANVDKVKRKKSSCVASLEPKGKNPEDPEVLIVPPSNDNKQVKKQRLEIHQTAKVSSTHILITCKTIRIGTFESKPLARVVLSTTGLDMKVLLPTGQKVSILIPISDISEVMFSLSHTMPVLFVCIHGDGGLKVRKALDMSDSNNRLFYFDPSSRDETLRRIILFLETQTEDLRADLQKLGELSQKCFIEIASGPANEILVKSSPEAINAEPHMALCPRCGWLSLNLSKCRRCCFVLPGNVKKIPGSKYMKPPAQSTIVPIQNDAVIPVKRQSVPATQQKQAGKNIARPLKQTDQPADVELRKKRCSCTTASEILLISSDDDDQQSKKQSLETQPMAPDTSAYPHVLISCKTLRIGTYESQPLEGIRLSHNGVEMKVLLPSGQNVAVSIPISDIFQVMFSLSPSKPALFISLYEYSARKVRMALHMNDSNKKSFYFDPSARDEMLRQIVLLPEKLTDDFKMALQKLREAGSVPAYEIVVEPEIITLSSEDEDEEKRKKNPSSLPKGSVPHPFVSMACRSLRIGTYRTNPSQRVVLSSDGLEMKVPLPSGPNATVCIPMSDISQFIFSFSCTLPVLFLILYDHAASKVRKTLGMNDWNDPSFYFDPSARDEKLKRIIVLPEKLEEFTRKSIREILEVSKKTSVEISRAAADEILVKSILKPF